MKTTDAKNVKRNNMKMQTKDRHLILLVAREKEFHMGNGTTYQITRGVEARLKKCGFQPMSREQIHFVTELCDE